MSTAGKIMTNATIKDIMSDALVIRSIPKNADLNDIRQNGIYMLYGSESNLPDGFGIGTILEVMRWDMNRCYQRVIGTPGVVWRVMISNNTWRNWRKLTDSALSGGVIYCPLSLKGGGRHEYGREKVFGNTIARRSLSDTWSVLGWLGGKSACVGVNDVQRKSLGLKRCLGSDRAVSSEHRVSELSTWNNAKPFGRDTVSERDSVWHSSVVRNEYAKQHSCAHKNRIFIQRLVSSDHDILAGKEVAA